MALTPPVSEPISSVISSLILLPFRLVRDFLPNSSLVAGVETVSDDIFPEIERLASENEEIRTMLTPALISASQFAGSMLENYGKHKTEDNFVFSEAFYNRFVELSKTIVPLLSNAIHRRAIELTVDSLGKFNGKDARSVYEFLHREPGSDPDVKFREPKGAIQPSDRLTSRFSGGLDILVSETNDLRGWLEMN